MAPRLAETALAAGVALVVLTAEPVDAGGLQVSGTPPFSEAAWPFLIDQWGGGRAFRCDPCGAQLALYVRTKVGFCNCTTGVSDDDELNRLSDFNLIGDKFSVLGPGHPITVAWMKGRSRPYAVVGPFRAGQSALTVAFNDHCDAIVATVVVSHERPTVIEPTIIEFLNSKTILGWAEVTLGL
jgi:hypothetical protein